MIRRFNFTGRKDIPSSRIRIVLEPGGDPRFVAQWDLEGLRLSDDAHVVIETYVAGGVQVERYDFGTVSEPAAPEDNSLHGLPVNDVRFNFKVVDLGQHTGRLLAVALGLNPFRSAGDAETGRHPLLPIDVTDLGDQVWRIRFDDTGPGRPVLQVTSKIEGMKERALHDRAFFALVYPQVVRDILAQIIITNNFNDPTGDGADWMVNWLKWAIAWHPDHEMPDCDETDEDGRSRREWIEKVISAFCSQKHVAERYAASFDQEAHS